MAGQRIASWARLVGCARTLWVSDCGLSINRKIDLPYFAIWVGSVPPYTIKPSIRSCFPSCAAMTAIVASRLR